MDSRPLVGVDPFGRDDLRYSVVTELDSPAVGGRVAAGFDDAVVVVADEHQVAERRFSARPPGHPVVRLTRGGWFVAADKDAAAVPQLSAARIAGVTSRLACPTSSTCEGPP